MRISASSFEVTISDMSETRASLLSFLSSASCLRTVFRSWENPRAIPRLDTRLIRKYVEGSR
jgi:hypothetical protein